MTRDTKVQIAALLVLAGSLAASVAASLRVTASAARHRLTYTTNAEEGQPPQVGIGIAMGAFRGIFVNFLWMRADEMKQAGRHHEAYQLARAITILQPRFPSAWSFNAWNLAYNISVTTQTRMERWNWVLDGINLLRREGLKYNPNSLLLSKEIGWIYLHKVQGITDDANVFYKKMHALEWQIVLGTPPQFDPAAPTKPAMIKKYTDWLAPIAAAPGSMDALFRSDESGKVQQLVAAIEKTGADRGSENAVVKSFGIDFLRRRERLLALPRAAVLAAAADPAAPAKPGEHKFEREELALQPLLNDPQYAEAWPKLLAFCRARVLADEYRMDVGIMIRYTNKYGPLDWRHPAAHSLYWAALGVENAATRVTAINRRDFDFVNTDRIVIQSVQELYRSGVVWLDFSRTIDSPEKGDYMQTVDVYFVDTYGDIIEDMRTRSPSDDMAMHGWTMYSHGYENFLKDAVRFFFRRGQLAEAEKYRKRLADYPGMSLNDPYRNYDVNRRLEDLIREELVDRQSSPNVAMSEVDGAIEGALTMLLEGNQAMFRTQMAYAEDFWNYFRTKQHKFTSVNPDDPRMAQLNRTFVERAGNIAAWFLRTRQPAFAERIYNACPTDLQRAMYDNLLRFYAEEIQAGAPVVDDRTFSQVFPEPTGMAEYRAKRDAGAGVKNLNLQEK